MVQAGVRLNLLYIMKTNQNSKDRELKEYSRVLDEDVRCRIIVNQITAACRALNANYLEANEVSKKKDFMVRARLCRRETKESERWLLLLNSENKA